MVKAWNTCQHARRVRTLKSDPVLSQIDFLFSQAALKNRLYLLRVCEGETDALPGEREQLSLIPLKMLRFRLVWLIPCSRRLGQSSSQREPLQELLLKQVD